MGDSGAIFFVAAVVIGHLILLNLFLAILLVEFEREKEIEKQKIEVQQSTLRAACWWLVAAGGW